MQGIDAECLFRRCARKDEWHPGVVPRGVFLVVGSEDAAHRSRKTARCKHRSCVFFKVTKKNGQKKQRPNPVVNDAKMNWSFVEGSIRSGLCGGEGGGWTAAGGGR
jgi:hypothetical protein